MSTPAADPAADASPAADPGSPRVSVVVPVYNAGAHLEECLRSIEAQTLGFHRIEVVAVDDGSTDGSGAVLDDWARRHPGRFSVTHQPNSGAPGGPRNLATARARGEFVFFADPDDYLGPEALARLTEAADRDGADIVLGRIKGVGRAAAARPFARNLSGGDIWSTHAVWSLTAHKLFRRSLVERHRLRFTEGLRLAEEQEFLVPAYFAASSISVVADYDCYYLVHRPGFAHLTRQSPDPEPFYAAMHRVLTVVHERTEPGEKRNALLKRWLDHELTRNFKGGYHKLEAELRHRHIAHAAPLLRELVPDELIEPLPPAERVRVRLIREGRADELSTFTELFHRDRHGAGGTGNLQTKPAPPPSWLSAAGAARAVRGVRRRLEGRS